MASIRDMIALGPPDSAMPAGGTPRDDAVFEDWIKQFIDDTNRRLLDSHDWFLDPRLAVGVVESWGLRCHLFDEVCGRLRFERWALAHRHRLLAIEYRDNPERIERIAAEYAGLKCADYEDCRR